MKNTSMKISMYEGNEGCASAEYYLQVQCIINREIVLTQNVIIEFCVYLKIKSFVDQIEY